MGSRPLQVTVWATTFGADLLSLCRFLDRREEVRLTIFLQNPRIFRKEAVFRLSPLRAPLLRRRRLPLHLAFSSRADVTIVDNGVPLLKSSRTLFVLWHGFGWKGPDDRNAFAFMRQCIARHWGDPTQPNHRFLWQCFGEWDRRFRAEVSGFHPDNLAVLGSAFHDEVADPLDRAVVAPFYPFDIQKRKTVLLAPTWHYDGIFSQWGREADLFEQLLSRLEARGVNLILRMHDRWRYPASYLSHIRKLGRRYPGMLVKFKDTHQDNTVDLRLADVLLTNFSSIANYFYATGRPTIHIYPVQDADQPYQLKRLWAGSVRKIPIPSARTMWKLPLEENGGLVATSFPQLLDHLDRALDEPDCCREKSKQFLTTYMLGADGNSRQRIFQAMKNLAQYP
ncbi:MAG: CDP-glycerol glycerophosphotransferase family protein [Bradymonadales bacterium]|nr:CDP-glycerol glycerophosphotransferase family protein [Bradymonadales bacterium]